MRPFLPALLVAALAGCSEHSTSDHVTGLGIDARGVPQISPLCAANIQAVRAIEVNVARVPRGEAERAGYQARVTIFLGDPVERPAVKIRDDVTGWYEAALLLHEKCHVFHYRTTGKAEFHR